MVVSAAAPWASRTQSTARGRRAAGPNEKGLNIMNRSTSCTTRRNFVKAAGVAAASTVALSAGTALADEAAWDEEFELVVVGGGLAGFSTAVAAVNDCGATSVLLAEKGSIPGGCSPFSVCRCVYTDDYDGFLIYMEELEGGRTNTPTDVLEAFAQGSVEVLDWVKSLGVNVDEMSVEAPGTPSPTQPTTYPEYPELEGAQAVGNFRVGTAEGAQGPRSLYIFLQQWVEEHADAVDYRTEFPVSELIQDETGRVVGVVANGERIHATKGVVMCCGGFENNTTMLEDTFGILNLKSVAATLNTGDGHKMCTKIGADSWHMNGAGGFWYCHVDANDLPWYCFAGNIVVGKSGRRFYYDGQSVPEGYQEVPIATAVGDRHGHQNFGGEFTHLPLPEAYKILDANSYASFGFNSPAGMTYEGDPVENGDAFMGETIEELAEACGLPADELAKSVETWNGFCEGGADLAQYRPADSMAALDTPPFYAIKLTPCFLNTDGGPRRSARAEILDVDGNPIAGLFSSGEFGSIHNFMYQGGTNVSECVIFGRIAAKSAFEA